MMLSAAAALLLVTACGEQTDQASPDTETRTQSQPQSTSDSDSASTTAANATPAPSDVGVAVTYVVKPSVDGDPDELLADAQAILTERLANAGHPEARIATDGTSGDGTSGDEGTLRIEFPEKPDPSVLEEVLLSASGQFRPLIVAAPPGADRLSSPDALQGEQPEGIREVDQTTLEAFAALDCTQGSAWPPEALTAEPTEPTIACSSSGSEKFLLEPAIHIPAASATAIPPDGTVSVWGVELMVTTEGTEELRIVTERLAPTQGRLAYLAEGTVISAPTVNSPITGGQLLASGYDEESAEGLVTWFRLSGHRLTFETVEIITD